MKYIIILWYMITPPLGDSVPSDVDCTTFPNPNFDPSCLPSASVEPLNHQRTIVILGRYDTKEACEAEVGNRVFEHMSNLDTRRSVAGAEFGCFQDPQE